MANESGGLAPTGDDAAILDCLAGNRQAFAFPVRRYQDRLYCGRRLLRGRLDLESERSEEMVRPAFWHRSWPY